MEMRWKRSNKYISLNNNKNQEEKGQDALLVSVLLAVSQKVTL